MNYKEEFKITDEEIKEAYKILFSEEGDFDDEKKQVIKSLESCVIEAVPGSGKTTTLVAKLIILAEKLKKQNCNRGICILTHTNIGIDIIKEKLGTKGEILFKYPNFVGTLQHFIDTYLAIPYFKLKYKRKVEIIDDDIVNNEYSNLVLYNRLLKNYLSKGNINTSDIIYDFENDIFKKPNLIDKNKRSYKILYTRVEKNLLKYEEAIQLGNLYLKEYPNLKKYFSKRFFLVQVDEMQDTSSEAFEVLEKLFDKEETIVQYVGDRNQNIMNGNEEWYNSSQRKYSLNSSKRFGKNIASFLNLLISNPEINIRGNSVINDYKPVLMLYNTLENNEFENNNKIFNEFIEIIKEKGLEQENGNFKVVGRIGKEKENKITIPSYFKRFSQKDSNNRSSLKFLINKNKKSMSKNRKIIKVLENKMSYYFKSFSKKKFKEYLEENNYKLEFYKLVYNYIKAKDEKKLFDDLFNFSKNITSNNQLKREIFDSVFISLEEEKQNSKVDIYTKNNIDLEINTVHSVKGETHLATLYLDTFYKKYDISKYLIDLIAEKLTTREKNQIENIARKKVIFVGASRPKHLLCFACEDITLKLSEEENTNLENIFDIRKYNF